MWDKRRITIFGSLIFVVALVITVLIFLVVRDKPSGPPEIDSPGTVVIDNTDELRGILLPRQYTTVLNEVVALIQDKIGPNTEHAVVKGVKVNRDGSVKVTFDVDGPSEPFLLLVDRSAFDKIVLTIPAYSYKKTMSIY
jgi:hypothetical protein